MKNRHSFIAMAARKKNQSQTPAELGAQKDTSKLMKERKKKNQSQVVRIYGWQSNEIVRNTTEPKS